MPANGRWDLIRRLKVKVGSTGRFLWKRLWTVRFHSRQQIPSIPENALVSQEIHCSTELIVTGSLRNGAGATTSSWLDNQGFESQQRQEIFPFSKSPDEIWRQPSLLLNAYGSYKKRLGRMLTIHLHLALRLRIGGAITYLYCPSMPSWIGQGQHFNLWTPFDDVNISVAIISLWCSLIRQSLLSRTRFTEEYDSDKTVKDYAARSELSRRQ